MGGTIYGVKSFAANRASYIDNFVDCATISVNGLNAISSLQVYPNPFVSNFILEHELIDDLEISVVDIMGSQIKFSKQKITSMKKQINLEAPSGVYFVSIEINGEKETRKIISK